MNKDARIKELEEEIASVEEYLETMMNRKNELEKEMTEITEKIEKAAKAKESLSLAKECIIDYNNAFPMVIERIEPIGNILKQKDVPNEEHTCKTKIAKVGRFDKMGNQTGLWQTQAGAAKDIGLTQAGLSYIMKTSKEAQIKKRGCYFVWVH